MNTDQKKLSFMELIFFVQKMPLVSVKMERDGFMVSNPQTHIHLTYTADMIDSSFSSIKEFIIQADQYNENNIIFKTHEELKLQGLTSVDFLSQPGGVNKVLQTKEQRELYLNFIQKVSIL